jgi:hypothetical protein
MEMRLRVSSQGASGILTEMALSNNNRRWMAHSTIRRPCATDVVSAAMSDAGRHRAPVGQKTATRVVPHAWRRDWRRGVWSDAAGGV